jgi:hypothetical protein
MDCETLSQAMQVDFEARRDAVLAEANAIGTTALRARLSARRHCGRGYCPNRSVVRR